MFDPSRCHAVAASVDALAQALDVERLSVADAQALVPVVAAMGRQLDAIQALLAARIADGATTDRDVARWWAAATGETQGEARRRLDTGCAVRTNHATRQAFQGGRLSEGTAREIGRAVDADPVAERRLLDRAADGSAEDARREARRTRLRAGRESEAEREARRHRTRSLTWGEDDDGGTAGRFATTNQQWARTKRVLDVCTEAAFRRARRQGERAATRSGYAMDGWELMAHIAGGGHPGALGYEDADLPAALRGRVEAAGATTPSDGPSPTVRGGAGAGAPTAASKVIIRVDVEALRRGAADVGETCEIAGVGPVPVASVREALGSAFTALLVTDGRDVLTVAHAGRRPDAWQQTALEWGLDECCTQGCHHRARIEIDHSHDWSDTRYTFLQTLRGCCSSCHRLRGLGHAHVGPPDAFGRYRLVPPGHPDHPGCTGEAPPRPTTVRPVQRRRERTDHDPGATAIGATTRPSEGPDQLPLRC